MSNDVTCRVLLKNYNDIKNLTLGETAPDFEYKCTAYQYCCYNYTVPHSPWCCDASYTLPYKDWYLWVILSLITILICALFFYFRFYQKRQLERRIHRAKLELEAHYRPLGQQIAISRRDVEDDDKSWTTEDPPPCYNDIMASPPSYSSNKNIATSFQRDATPTQSNASPSLSSAMRTAIHPQAAASSSSSSGGVSRNAPLSYSPLVDNSRRQLPRVRDNSGPYSR